MTGTLVRSGPWPGGAEYRDQAYAGHLLDPGQLRFVKNLDITDVGTLQCRLGCRKTGGPALYTDLSSTGKLALLGSVDTSDRQYAVIGSHNGLSPGTTVVRYTTDGMSNLDISWTVSPGGSLTGQFSTLFQYNGFVYAVAKPSGGGSGQRRADITSGAWSAVAALPAGDLAALIRDRAFVVDKAANRIYWSKATDPTVWAAPDGGFVDVDPGDGQTITDVVVVNSQMYIFKRNRTYLLTFTADPALDGQRTLINSGLGAYSAALYGDAIFVVNDRSVHRFVNGYFTDIGQRIDFPTYAGIDGLQAPGTVVAIERDQLVVGPVPANTLFTHYAMNLRTGAWSARFYDDSLVAPSTKQIGWRDPSFANGSAGVLYGHGTRVLSGTRTRNALGDPTGTLDINSSDQTISPEYSLTTPEATFGDYSTWKRAHYLVVRTDNQLVGGDNALTATVRLGPSTATDAQTPVAVPVQYGGRLPLKSFRCRSFSARLAKASKNLGAANANSNHWLVVKEVEAYMSGYGRRVSVA